MSKMECKKKKRKGDKAIPWEYRGYLIRRRYYSYNYAWTAINEQGREVLVDKKLKSLCLKIDRVGDAVAKKSDIELTKKDNNERVEDLEACLEEIERVALVSEGVEFYAMLARKGLDGEYVRDPQP